MSQSFTSAPIQITTYLLGQKGNDLCTYSVQPLDNFCLQVTRKKKFNYISSQTLWSPMKTEDTFVWVFFISSHPLARTHYQNNKFNNT